MTNLEELIELVTSYAYLNSDRIFEIHQWESFDSYDYDPDIFDIFLKALDKGQINSRELVNYIDWNAAEEAITHGLKTSPICKELFKHKAGSKEFNKWLDECFVVEAFYLEAILDQALYNFYIYDFLPDYQNS